MKIAQIINEIIEKDNIFVDGYKSLWTAYGDNSGQVLIVNTDKMKTYYTDKKKDENYNPTLVEKLIKNSIMPIKSKGNQKLFSLPFYEGKEQKKYDIWGGDEKPKKMKYYIISTGKINVITFFDKKGEALSWLKTTV